MNTKTKQWLSMVALAATLAAAQRVTAMAGTHGKGDPKHPISCSRWPKGVAELANRTDRIGGHWINANDWFHYSGDAKAFNDFLAGYARLEGKPLLFIGDPQSLIGALLPNTSSGYDWEMNVSGWTESVCVTLVLGNRIRLKDLKVPANIRVEFSGEKTREVEAFLAKHQAQQEKAARDAKKANDKPSKIQRL